MLRTSCFHVKPQIQVDQVVQRSSKPVLCAHAVRFRPSHWSRHLLHPWLRKPLFVPAARSSIQSCLMVYREFTFNSSPLTTAIWLSVRYLSHNASFVIQNVRLKVSSPSGIENSGFAAWIVNGVLASCFSKTSLHFSCRKRGWLSSNLQVISLILDSHWVVGVHDLGALSEAE